MDKITLHDREFEIMIPAEKIEEAVTNVATKISNDYRDGERPLIVSILNGSFIFCADLVRKLDILCDISFVKLASYEGCSSTGRVKELVGVNCDVKGRDVIIVEDIVDSGVSIKFALTMLRSMGAKSVRVCTLFFKPAAYKGDEVIDYPAMEIGNDFIVGYGLDYNELGRQFKDIYVTR